MICPHCSGATSVTDSRDLGDGLTIKRRRRCVSCGARRTTIEVPVSDAVPVACQVENILETYGHLAVLSAEDLRTVLGLARRLAEPTLADALARRVAA